MLLPIALFFLTYSRDCLGRTSRHINIYSFYNFCCVCIFSNNEIFCKTSLLIGVKEKIVKKLNFNIKENIQVKYVVLCTLNPLLPQGPLNYAFGLTGLGLKTFIIIITLTSLGINFFMYYLDQA